MKHLARVTAIILLTVGIAFLALRFSSAVLLFVMSLILAAAVRPFAARLNQRGLSRGLAYALTYLFVLLLTVSLLVVIVPRLINELQRAGDDLLQSYSLIRLNWPRGSVWQQQIASELPTRQALLDSFAGQRGTEIVNTVIGFSTSVFDVLAQLVVVLSLSLYWASDQQRFERLWLSLVSPFHRSRARSIWREVEQEVGAYVRSELTQSVLAGVLLGLGYAVLGLKYPVLLALWAALTWLVPWVGVLLAVVPAVFVSWPLGATIVVLATVLTVIVFGIMEIWLEPRLYGRSQVSPVLVVILLMIMAQYAGVLGTLLAPPLAAAMQIFARRVWFSPVAKPQPVALMGQVIDLRTRLAELRLAALDDASMQTPKMINLIQQVEQLIDHTHATLDKNGMLVEVVEPASALQPQLTSSLITPKEVS